MSVPTGRPPSFYGLVVFTVATLVATAFALAGDKGSWFLVGLFVLGIVVCVVDWRAYRRLHGGGR